ncbi:MAG: hypothetical protein H7Z41_13630, partial [Cytophagales bacterium]|nr:hypothetical protein [Armatimonadota bacterium]
MRDFDLVSVDWDSVRLMQAGQFTQETYYLEELMRWTLHRASDTSGRLLHLTAGGVSQPSPEGDGIYSVSVRGCIGVGSSGYLIEIEDSADRAITGRVALGASGALFVGVAKASRDHLPELRPSADAGLLQCGGRRRVYGLFADDADQGRYDYLQVAQFLKTPGGLTPDPDWLPECAFLGSCTGLWRGHEAVRLLARRALETLERTSLNSPPVFAAAAALAASLGSAAAAAEERQSARPYFVQLAGALTAQRSQLRILPGPNLTVYQEAMDELDAALTYLDGYWTLGRALVVIRRCFERLITLYPPLMQSLNQAAPAAPPPPAQWEIAERAPRPVTS